MPSRQVGENNPYLGARTRWMVNVTPPAALPPENRPGTRCTGGWVGLGTGLNGPERSHPHRGSNLGLSGP